MPQTDYILVPYAQAPLQTRTSGKKVLRVDLNGYAADRIRIFNAGGQLVLDEKQPLNNTVDISLLAKGAYIAEVALRDVIVRVRWVKI